MITEVIKSLKSDTEWAGLSDYYLALTFLFDMVDTELSTEFNIAIGNKYWWHTQNWEIRMRFSFWLQYLRFESGYAKCECQRFRNVLWFR